MKSNFFKEKSTGEVFSKLNKKVTIKIENKSIPMVMYSSKEGENFAISPIEFSKKFQIVR